MQLETKRRISSDKFHFSVLLHFCFKNIRCVQGAIKVCGKQMKVDALTVHFLLAIRCSLLEHFASLSERQKRASKNV